MKTHIVSYQDDTGRFIAERKEGAGFHLTQNEGGYSSSVFALTVEEIHDLRDFLSELLSEEM